MNTLPFDVLSLVASKIDNAADYISFTRTNKVFQRAGRKVYSMKRKEFLILVEDKVTPEEAEDLPTCHDFDDVYDSVEYTTLPNGVREGMAEYIRSVRGRSRVIGRGDYVNGFREGSFEFYDEELRLGGMVKPERIRIANYKRGVLHGPQVTITAKEEHLMSKIYYENGFAEGYCIEYDEEGYISSYEFYEKSLCQGKSEKFDKNGDPWITEYYKDGDLIRYENH